MMNPIAASLAGAPPEPGGVRQLTRIDTRPATAPPRGIGSRRRRIWELDGHVHCPVIGVCIPLSTLRDLFAKASGGEVIADDYDLH